MPKNRYVYITIFLLSFLGGISYAQNVQDKVLLKEVLDVLANEHQVQFNYQSDLIENIYVLPVAKSRTLNQEIRRLENETSLKFSKIGANVIVITKPTVICGYLQEVSSEQPLVGATVQSRTNNTVSDDNGFFEIEVANIDEEIEIRFLGYRTLNRAARFFSLEQCGMLKMYEQQQRIAPVVLKGYLIRGIDKKADGGTVVDFSKFTILPGLIETDVLQSAQALPGIQSIDETVSNINIRGGSHDQNLILWDGIKMYQSGHFFGLISSFNPQITQNVNVISNGTEAAYTDGVSGTLLLNTDDNLQNKFSGNFGVNFINADLFADIPLGKKSSIQIAARRSIDDVVRTPTFDVFFERVTQETEIAENEESVVNSNQSFSFYDTSFRWLYKPSDNDRIRLNFILINNDLTFDETATLNGTTETRESSLSQNSIGIGIDYKRKWNSKFTTQINAYNTDYKLQANNSNVLLEQRFLQENIVSETGARIKGTYYLDDFILESGYHFTESEVVNINDIDVPRFLRRDSEILREHAAFAQVFYQDEKGWSIKPGIRANYIAKFDTILIEPRLSINKKLGEHVQLEVLGELKHQNTSQLINFQNDFLGVERRRWLLSDNDSIPILSSKQASLGVRYNKRGWLLDATGYYKEVDGITAQSQGFTTKFEAAKATGSYDVVGLDFLLRKQIKNLSAWASYSYMVNEYTFETLEDVPFPSNFDITHSLTVGASYSNNALRIAAGINYRTGAPTSVPLAGNEIVDEEINFDLANNNRLDDYLRVDASVLYKWKVSKGLYSEVGGSVWNVLNQENTINNFYRIAQDGVPNRFSRSSLGITSNFILRVYF